MEISSALEALAGVSANYLAAKRHCTSDAIKNTLEMESRRIEQASKVIHDELLRFADRQIDLDSTEQQDQDEQIRKFSQPVNRVIYAFPTHL